MHMIGCAIIMSLMQYALLFSSCISDTLVHQLLLLTALHCRYNALLAEVSAIRQTIEQCIPTQLDLSALKSINKKLKKCALWRKADAATTDNADGDGAKKKKKRKRDATETTSDTATASTTAAAGDDSAAGGASVSGAIDEIVAVGGA
jgi:hypothetical protein